MELDDSILYESNKYDSIESERPNDYTVYQLRSFAYCRAQKIANDRLYRMDELKAVIDQISSKEGIKDYLDLREEIVGSHAIEMDEDKTKEVSKEDKVKHNRQAAKGLMNTLG